MIKMTQIILSGNLIVNEQQEIYLLFRTKYNFYETPGGKVRKEEHSGAEPTIDELEAVAQRELLEEVTGVKEIESMNYFGRVEFEAPVGRKAIAHKFVTKVIGELSPGEDIFDTEKSKWIKINELDKYPLSTDLKLLLPKIKEELLNG